MSKLQVVFGQKADAGVVFINDKGKAETVQYEAPLETDKALSALKSEINSRHNVTRAALTMLVDILARERVAGYMGKGTLGEPGGIPNEAKSALRDAEGEHFKPMFDKVEKMDSFLVGLRDQGPYAVVKGVCRKYFYFMGKLPCAYSDNGQPDRTRLLAVSAMQKIMRNAEPDTDPKTYGDRIDEMRQQFEEDCEKAKDQTVDANIVSGLIARLKQFLEVAEQRRNVIAAAATSAAQAQAAMMQPQPNPAPAPTAAPEVPASEQVKPAKTAANEERAAAKGNKRTTKGKEKAPA
jgi:hypothetical protein